MLASERRQAIIDLVQKDAHVRIADLCARLGVSASTIRRDLAYLEQRQVLKRIHGGAVLSDAGEMGGLGRRGELFSPGEMRLGAAAAALVAEGETVFLGAGTGMLAVAQHIAHKAGVTVITHALDVATYLTEHSKLSVIVTGGEVEREETALLGYLAELTLRELRADRAILSVGGIQVPDGVTGESLPAVQLARVVLDLVPEVIIVADASRWGRVGPAFLAPLEAIDAIVTDRDAPPAMVWDLTELGLRIIQA